MKLSKQSNKGNRSSGTVHEYTQMMLKGMTLGQIGAHFNVTDGAIRKALKRNGMPTNPHKLLSAMPVGCTPTDAAVLRRANHALATENAGLKARLQKIESALKGLT